MINRARLAVHGIRNPHDFCILVLLVSLWPAGPRHSIYSIQVGLVVSTDRRLYPSIDRSNHCLIRPMRETVQLQYLRVLIEMLRLSFLLLPWWIRDRWRFLVSVLFQPLRQSSKVMSRRREPLSKHIIFTIRRWPQIKQLYLGTVHQERRPWRIDFDELGTDARNIGSTVKKHNRYKGLSGHYGL